MLPQIVTKNWQTLFHFPLRRQPEFPKTGEIIDVQKMPSSAPYPLPHPPQEKKGE